MLVILLNCSLVFADSINILESFVSKQNDCNVDIPVGTVVPAMYIKNFKEQAHCWKLFDLEGYFYGANKNDIDLQQKKAQLRQYITPDIFQFNRVYPKKFGKYAINNENNDIHNFFRTIKIVSNKNLHNALDFIPNLNTDNNIYQSGYINNHTDLLLGKFEKLKNHQFSFVFKDFDKSEHRAWHKKGKEYLYYTDYMSSDYDDVTSFMASPATKHHFDNDDFNSTHVICTPRRCDTQIDTLQNLRTKKYIYNYETQNFDIKFAKNINTHIYSGYPPYNDFYNYHEQKLYYNNTNSAWGQYYLILDKPHLNETYLSNSQNYYRYNSPYDAYFFANYKPNNLFNIDLKYNNQKWKTQYFYRNYGDINTNFFKYKPQFLIDDKYPMMKGFEYWFINSIDQSNQHKQLFYPDERLQDINNVEETFSRIVHSSFLSDKDANEIKSSYEPKIDQRTYQIKYDNLILFYQVDNYDSHDLSDNILQYSRFYKNSKFYKDYTYTNNYWHDYLRYDNKHVYTNYSYHSLFLYNILKRCGDNCEQAIAALLNGMQDIYIPHHYVQFYIKIK